MQLACTKITNFLTACELEAATKCSIISWIIVRAEISGIDEAASALVQEVRDILVIFIKAVTIKTAKDREHPV